MNGHGVLRIPRHGVTHARGAPRMQSISEALPTFRGSRPRAREDHVLLSRSYPWRWPSLLVSVVNEPAPPLPSRITPYNDDMHPSPGMMAVRCSIHRKSMLFHGDGSVAVRHTIYLPRYPSRCYDCFMAAILIFAPGARPYGFSLARKRPTVLGTIPSINYMV